MSTQMPLPLPTVVGLIIALALVVKCLVLLRKDQRGVVFRLGRVLHGVRGPGLVPVLWPIDRLVRISLERQSVELPLLTLRTRDGRQLEVEAVLHYRVVDPHKAVLEVPDYRAATLEIAVNTVRARLDALEHPQVLDHRRDLALQLQAFISQHSEAWGVHIAKLEIRDTGLY